MSKKPTQKRIISQFPKKPENWQKIGENWENDANLNTYLSKGYFIFEK